MSVAKTLEEAYRSHYRTLLAPTIRLLGRFDVAEEVVQDVFATALTRWESDGVPDIPLAWLRRATKNRALDVLKRRATRDRKAEDLGREVESSVELAFDDALAHDDALRLIFTCCHPSLAVEAQIALTLRTVCGLTSDEVARAFLLKRATLQQRLVRAQKKIDEARIPFRVPEQDELAERLEPVLKVIYLVFNEGYTATEDTRLIRPELCEEAIRLAQVLWNALGPRDRWPAQALLALMLLHHARRAARVDAQGDLIRLEDQDRTRWDRAAIEAALPLVEEALKARPTPSYAIEAAIAALHARAERPEETDWEQIAALYEILLVRSGPNPVLRLNAAVARALAGELDRGLADLDRLAEEGELKRYHLLAAAQGDLLAKAGRNEEARSAFERALTLTNNEAECRYLSARLEALQRP